MQLDGYDTVDNNFAISSDQSVNLQPANEIHDSSQSEVEMNACYTIHRELLNSRSFFENLGLNSEGILSAVRALSNLEYVEAYERMSWFVLEIALTFNTPKLFEDDPELQTAKDALVAALDQFCVEDAAQSAPSAGAEHGALYEQLPKGPITEATVDYLLERRIVFASILDCWAQAILLSQVMGQSTLSKTISKYAAHADAKDPFFTLILVGNGLVAKVFELNAELLSTWPKHASYLLMNSQACNARHIGNFLGILGRRIGEVSFVREDVGCVVLRWAFCRADRRKSRRCV